MEEDYIKEKCPVCGGDIMTMDEGWECDNQMNAVTPCPFSVEKQINGATITEDIVRELCLNGRSRILTMNDKSGKQYLAHLEFRTVRWRSWKKDCILLIAAHTVVGAFVSQAKATTVRTVLVSILPASSIATAFYRIDSSHRMSWRPISTGIRPSLTAASTRRDGSSLPSSWRTSRMACR